MTLPKTSSAVGNLQGTLWQQERLQIDSKGSSSAVGGINLQGTLEQQKPLQIDSKGQLQTTKEHWRWEYCKMSLEKKGLYEAPGNLLWLSMDRPTWQGEALLGTDITYGQVAAGRQLWSDEKFLRSSHDEQKRHYIINGSIPTAVTSAVDVPTKPSVGFVNLPCLSSRAVLCGWYSVVDDALRVQETKKVLKLYEAALSFPMRLHCAPSRKQICLDSTNYSEDLFIASSCSADSFLDFTEKVLGVFPRDPAFGGLPVKSVIRHAEKSSLTTTSRAVY